MVFIRYAPSLHQLDDFCKNHIGPVYLFSLVVLRACRSKLGLSASISSKSLAISNYRKLKPQSEEVDFAIYETPLCTLIKTEHQKTIWGQAKRLLSMNQFTCLRLFYGEGMKANQIAEAMDVSVSSVKVCLHRARKRLAAHLKPT